MWADSARSRSKSRQDGDPGHLQARPTLCLRGVVARSGLETARLEPSWQAWLSAGLSELQSVSAPPGWHTRVRGTESIFKI